MTPKPIYEVNHNRNPHYPWGFHYQVHIIREIKGPLFVACEPDDRRRDLNAVGVFDVGNRGEMNFRGRYTTLRDALSGLVFQALSGMDYGHYDPYNNGIPLTAVNVMLITLSNDETDILLQNPDLLSDTMRQLAEAVDKAVNEAIQTAAEEVFASRSKPDDPAALELLKKGESSLGVITMAHNRATALGWNEPKTPSDFLFWIEDEAKVLSAVPSDLEVNQYINDLNLLGLRLRSLGIMPCQALPLVNVQEAAVVSEEVLA